MAGLRSAFTLLTLAFGFAGALRVRFAGALAVGIRIKSDLYFLTIDHFEENGSNSGQFANWIQKNPADPVLNKNGLLRINLKRFYPIGCRIQMTQR